MKMSTSSSNSNLGWSQHIETILQVKDAAKRPVCIYKVPRILRDLKPEAYEPQLIGLGPYHHCRDNLFLMEHNKLIASKKYIDLDDKLLAWIMVIDSIFLVQFLLGIDDRENASCLWDSTRTRYLLDQNQSAYHSILKDIMKLENQIPIFVLNRIFHLSASDITGDYDYDHPLHTQTHHEANDDHYDHRIPMMLKMILLKACLKLSPLPTNETHLISHGNKEYAHLLELMYYLIVPKADTLISHSEYSIDQEGKRAENKDQEKRQKFNWSPDKWSIKLATFDQLRIVQKIKQIKPVQVIYRITRIVIEVIPSISSNSWKQKSETIDPEKGGNSHSNREGAPTVEEIAIPSVSKLESIGVQFCHTDGPITSINFDKRSRKFHLPAITIDDNTEVIIRNLVAYEAQAFPCPLYLARYTELMDGIIDTPEDVKLLRNKGIIKSYLKKDEYVAELWNGMSRSIRLSRVPSIDKAIEEVNKYYKNNTKVKFMNFTKECMFVVGGFLCSF
uniref:Uncharacterized protein n=1 Tax=Chenopodium quinoa TaxID=63459 RepID=A0A803LWZ8_CHEQI